MLKTVFKAGALALAVYAMISAPSRAAGLPDLGGVTIQFATSADYAPYAQVDDATKAPVGYDIDLVNEIAKRLNARINWKIASWDVLLQAVRDGQFDGGTDGITINDERKQVVDFTDSYYTSQTRQLVRADETRFTDSKSFAANPKLTVVVPAGTSQFYTATAAYFGGDEKNPRMKLYENFGTGILALVSGDVDLALTDAVNADIFVKNSGGKLKALPEVLGAESFGIVFHKGSKYTAAFNAALAELKAEGFYDKLADKWLVEKKK